MCNQALDMIKSRRVKTLFQIEDFEKALTNIYLASGNSLEKAQQKTMLDIEATVSECAYAYAPNATNCFAQEYYRRNLEV